MATGTREKILESARTLFNERGYVGTKLVDIADRAGIAEGNLWYHFRSKADLVRAIGDHAIALTAQRIRDQRANPGPPLEDFVRFLLIFERDYWEHRFLMRDRLQYPGGRAGTTAQPVIQDELSLIADLVRRIGAAGLCRRNLHFDPDGLARSLWMIVRYWGEHLEEQEGVSQVTWNDNRRAVSLAVSVLAPCLTAPARRKLEALVASASRDQEFEAVG